ncbi:MAG: hypothetical protein WKF30_06635 [Pyrinomonadaceae bacterium]
MSEMAFSMMSNRQKQRFKEAQNMDVAYGLPSLGRFRINIFQQCGAVSLDDVIGHSRHAR